ncbi:MAG: hypothetical protein A2057_11700 [Ignavibacteria bacterium GWA2_35_9]|nr:MAG: hypothetical protein A2057_11700 [Ignavibacteria bacterium GWA2_35_9]OGU48516.1 MAG: hypothetical protein A2000_16145 [Ignavibacteria bacterium GWB2_36_8]OGU50644.1 MAG: hypothetical protein A2080_15100 [Ignavibacteria bacterium GWC2_36_12]
MKIPVIDKSNYLKGLLITARKDKKLAESEKKIIREIAERLGFSSDFYEETLQNLLRNKYLIEDPIRFSDIIIAESFISDALKLAFSDNKTPTIEIDWLKKTAAENGITLKWFEEKIQLCKMTPGNLLVGNFALLSII